MLAVAAFAVALIIVAVFASRQKLDDTLLVHKNPVVFDAGWSVETDGGLAPLSAVSRSEAGCPEGTLRLINTLPDDLPDDMSLCVQTKNESVRVWVGDTLVYEYGHTPQRVYGHGVGAIWNIAELSTHAHGQTVTVEMTSYGERTGLVPYSFLLGSYSDIVFRLVWDRFAIIVIGLLLALVCLASLVMYVVWTVRKSRRSIAALYFAIFVLTTIVWMMTDSGLVQFVLPSKGVIYLLFGSSFYLFCTPFTLFLAVMLPKHKGTFLAFSVVSSVYAIVRIVLFATGLVNYETALWTLHLMMGVMIVYTAVVLWLPMIRNREIELTDMSLAVSVLAIAEGVSLVSFYWNDKLNVLRNGYSSGFYIGIFLFVIVVIAGVVYREQQLRQQAFKAAYLEKRAYADELTGLLNVKGFDDKCGELLKSIPADACCAVVDFDVNFFSQYNANNGLAAGDELLKKIAASLSALCGENELCARQEADHFVCMACGDSLAALLARVREADSAAHADMSANLLQLSYGIAEITDRTEPLPAVRNRAVVAKRTVKGKYENNIAVYDRKLHMQEMQEVTWLSGFEESLENNAYVIFLQPKINVKTERIAGAEALVRRIEADGSVISAGPIIEALERKGFVTKLDYHVLGLVCRFLRRSLSEGRRVYPISSNFSRMHLYDPAFPDNVAKTVDAYGIPHGLIEIELTETAFLVGNDVLQSMVRRLHAHGFTVAIDDFGSGFSSLNMLKDVEADVIKLDREFLSGFSENGRADTIIAHTLKLAQDMRITAVAEGIETAAQLGFLRGLGCTLIQGYYFSRPLPEDVFTEKYLPFTDPSARMER